MNENSKKTSTKPTIIITGFLGSGKTTYLNDLLERSSDTRYAIIENEYGKESIDSDLIFTEEDDIIELNNGCLCCTLNDNLYEILNRLYVRRDDYDELIIEATGMADPRGIAAPFLTNPAIKKQFPLKAIVCIIDAELIEDQLSDTVEAIHQVTYSDILLINKVDLVSDQYVSSLVSKMGELNPLATIIIGKEEGFPTYDLSHKSLNSISDSNENGSLSEHDEFPVEQPSHHHHDHSHTDVVTHTFIFDSPFDLQKLRLRLMAFLMFQSRNLYRMKGIIKVANSDEQYLIQSVGIRLSIDIIKKNTSGSKIIIIGKNLKRDGFENMFNQCLQD